MVSMVLFLFSVAPLEARWLRASLTLFILFFRAVFVASVGIFLSSVSLLRVD